MVPQRENLLAALLVGAAALVASWLFPASAHAQLSGPLPVITVPGSVTSDPPVEASLTTTTVGGWYNPQASLLGNITQTIFSGINPANSGALLPVTQGLPCDSYDPMISTIAPTIARTYNGAISETEQLTTELSAEDFSAIAANVQAPAELAATQGVGQAVMALVQEMRLMRAQMAALTMVIATDRLHQLDSTVRSMMPRQGAGC
jgi:hypothetical protein